LIAHSGGIAKILYANTKQKNARVVKLLLDQKKNIKSINKLCISKNLKKKNKPEFSRWKEMIRIRTEISQM
jgi:hypothetical protein